MTMQIFSRRRADSAGDGELSTGSACLFGNGVGAGQSRFVGPNHGPRVGSI